MRFQSRAARAAVVVGAVAAMALSPRIAWRFTRSLTMNVVVVDKTVPFRNYREHAAIAWLLHALKIRQASGEFLGAATGYRGFDPDAKTGHDLTSADLEPANALVITDTYGVYEGDYLKPGDTAALERSPKIYGGLSDDEAAAIDAFAARGGLVLAEFNTFASPTPTSARARLERMFGVRWTRWVARYWPDLQDDREVPRWVGQAYQRAYGEPFDFKGAGLVFVHEDGDIVVLRANEDLEHQVLTQERTRVGAEFGFPARGSFWYWFDVVDVATAEVLYEHVVHATSGGAQKLALHGLPTRFAAMTRRANAYYFAGDFVDTSLELGSPERAWLLGYKQARAAAGLGDREESFFWGFYAPIVARLLLSRAR